LILSLAGVKDRGDDIWKWYYQLIDSHAEKLDIGNRDSVFEQSCKVYFELVKKVDE